MKELNVGLIGVNGYTGMELVRLLSYHPQFKLNLVSSRSEEGKKLVEIYPFVQGHHFAELTITNPSVAEIKDKCELVFLAVPHGVAMTMAQELLSANIKVVDLSADFRIHDKDIFEEWYKTEHTTPQLLEEAVYGLPELYSPQIKKAQLVANPGCYPTASILGLAPAIDAQIIQNENIIIDAKSGASGAGRKASIGSLFCEVYDTFKAYGLTNHRHTPEIEQEIGLLAKQKITLSFNAHLVPMNRGILATIYTKLKSEISIEEVRKIYQDYYHDSIFVRVLGAEKLSETRYVKGTMFCDLGLVIDKRTKQLIITSAIDNLCRGASGQAIANANLCMGLELNTGLDHLALML